MSNPFIGYRYVNGVGWCVGALPAKRDVWDHNDPEPPLEPGYRARFRHTIGGEVFKLEGLVTSVTKARRHDACVAYEIECESGRVYVTQNKDLLMAWDRENARLPLNLRIAEYRRASQEGRARLAYNPV